MKKIPEILFLIKKGIFGYTNYYRHFFYWNPEKVKKYKNIHRGSTIFVVGAGPSLNEENLKLLSNQIVMSCNAGYMALNEISTKAHYWCIIDQKRMNKFRNVDRSIFNASFRLWRPFHLTLLRFGAIKKEDIVLRSPLIRNGLALIEDKEKYKSFSLNLEDYITNIRGSGTVVFAGIQLAAYMGAKRIILLGIDLGHNNGKETHFVDMGGGGAGDYFKENYSEKIRPYLVKYKNELEKKGIELINASRITRDDVLEKGKLEEIVQSK